MQSNSQTYERQILPGTKAGSTCSQEVFPVNRFQLPESEKEPKMTAICGPKCSELFGLFDPVGSWARTFTGLLVGRTGWYSNRCALTWKRKATKSSRMYFQLAVSALHTKDTGHGLLPTAQTQGLKMCENGKTKFYPLGLLPTPRTKDVGRGSVKDAKYENGVFFRENKQGVRWGVQLPDLIARGLLPTPMAGDYRSGMQNRAGGNHTQQLNDTVAYHAGKTSQLNPLFVAEMMGFPADWTELPFRSGEQKASKPTETP